MTAPQPAPGPSPVDAPERERVRAALRQSLCVEAAAGTGKTSLLLDRAVALLQSGLAAPAQLAAITFTELAAAELKSRLQRRVAQLDPRLAGELEAAQISTIHALALAILRERPVEAGLHPGFEVLDPARSEELLDELWRAWLARELASDTGAAVFRLALEAGLQLEHLRRAALQLYGQRDVVLEALRRQSGGGVGSGPAALRPEAVGGELEALRAELEALLQPGGALDVAGVSADDGLAGAIRELRDRAGQLLEAGAALPEPAGGHGETGPVALAAALRWVRTLLEVPALSRSSRRVGRADRWPSREALQAARDALETLRQRLRDLDGRLSQAVAVTISAWLCGLVAWAQEEKRRRGLVDFLDQLLWCRDLLRGHLEVRRHFQQRWRYILVDEFQDTDPLQAEIIFYLAEEEPRASRWDEVRLACGKLFVVGDPKQSIYRFRRADVETYERAARLVGAQGERLTIRQNFRTVPAITAWVNRIFGHLMDAGTSGPEPVARAYQPPYVALEPYRQAPRPQAAELKAPGVYLLRPRGLADDAPVGEARRAEAHQLARAIRTLVMGGRLRIWDGERGAWRPAGPGDVAVLMPTFTDIEIYEQQLRAAGVPFRVVGGRLFFHRDEIRELVLFLSAVDNPCDPVAVLGSLRSAFFGVPDDALVRWVQAGGRLDALQEPPPAARQAAPEVAEALRRLRDGHRETAHLAPSRAVRRLVDETGYRAFVALRPDGEQALANLAKVEAYAAAADDDGWGTFHAFVRWLRRRSPQGPAAAEEEDSPLAVGDDVVRIMTVHRAKGLEFPVVFVANLFKPRDTLEPVVVDREAGRVELRLGPAELGLATPGYEAAAEAERERQHAEHVRLYYVAMTRARDYLIVSGAGVRHGFWSLVTERSGDDPDVWPPELAVPDSPDEPAQGPADGEAAAAREAAEDPGLPPRREPPGAAFGEFEQQTAQWLEQRARLLARASRGLEVHAAGTGDGGATTPPAPGSLPSVAPLRSPDGLGAPAPEDGLEERLARWDGTRAGAAFHLIMERAGAWGLNVPASWIERHLDALARRLGLSEAERRAVREWAERACGPESPLRALMAGGGAWMVEVPFTLARDGALWEGRVDVVVRRPGGTVAIVDYKTDDLPPEGLLQRHGPQLQAYARALERITSRPVSAYLYAARLAALVPLSPGRAAEFGAGAGV